MIKRFLLGSVTSALLAFVPYTAISAISVWVFGKHDPKFSAFDAWLQAAQIAGIIMIATLIGFSVAFPLLYRVTVDQRMWRYLVTVTVPVGMIYLIAFTGIGELALHFINPQSLATVVLFGIVMYLVGILCAIGFTFIKNR